MTTKRDYRAYTSNEGSLVMHVRGTNRHFIINLSINELVAIGGREAIHHLLDMHHMLRAT